MSETAISRRFLRNKALKGPFGAPLAQQVRAEGPNSEGSKHPRVAIETASGTLTVELEEQLAPLTVANFLRYVDAGAYNGGQFHRTVKPDNQPASPIKIGVVQGSRRAGSEAYPALALERTTVTGLRHLHGSISMARTGPDTAVDQFFLCVGDQPELDFGGQ